MGVWGVGLYSGDFALDLRSMISSLSRLPYSGDQILTFLREYEPAADNVQNEDHTAFWLVVADQFQKRGIPCGAATQMALVIIESRADSAMLRKLGATEAVLRKREQTLADLAERLIGGTPAGKRHTLRSPQRFIMDIGDVYAYPTSRGREINPYFKSKDQDRGWVHDGWSAMVIINRGRSFEYLTWYAGLVLDRPYAERLTIEQLLAHSGWVVTDPGTCPPVHLRRMEMELLGRMPIDANASAALHPPLRRCIGATVIDRSIANEMTVRRRGVRSTAVERLADVLA